MTIIRQSSSTVRSIFIPEITLMALDGVGVYQFDASQNTTTEIPTYSPGKGAVQFFEACVIGNSGSWWTPTAAVNLVPFAWNNTAWGGITNLTVKGKGIWVEEGPNRVVRPAALFWWIPRALLFATSFPLIPAVNDGELLGQFPNEQPGGTPAKPTVETTADGFLITVPPGNESTTVTVANNGDQSL